MERLNDIGVTCYEEDRDNGPFMLRIGGSNEFVSEIDPDCPSSWPPGRVEVVEGRSHSEAMRFPDMDGAIFAATQVWDIEGFHVIIEPTLPEAV